VGKPILELSEVVLRGPSPFSEGVREMIAAYVSGLNDCKFCWAVHSATAERMGVTPARIPDPAQQLDASAIDARMIPVLEFARKLTRDPSSLTETDGQSVLAAGWDHVALFHLVCITALLNFMNRFVEGLRIEATDAQTAKAAQQLSQSGYAPLLRTIARSMSPPD
jgi:uncharacterized peroxidase-related enzyme